MAGVDLESFGHSSLAWQLFGIAATLAALLVALRWWWQNRRR